jgi:hypothetical protein
MIQNEPLLAKAWQQFTGDGHYRLVRLSDMKYTEDVKKELAQTQTSWQAEYGPYGGVAAIVVDTSQEGDERFGIVICRGVGKAYPYPRYDMFWLYKDRDLSTAAIRRASGYLWLQEYNDGQAKRCDIEWDEKAHRFVCN